MTHHVVERLSRFSRLHELEGPACLLWRQYQENLLTVYFTATTEITEHAEM